VAVSWRPDFRHPENRAQPYNPDFAAMGRRSAGVEGVNVDRAADLFRSIANCAQGAAGRISSMPISALTRIRAAAGVWELPGLGQSQPAFGGR